ncbi:hypothetical protein D3C83_192740 [compost metagenome]
MPRSGIEIEKSDRNSSRNASNSWSERSSSSISRMRSRGVCNASSIGRATRYSSA